MTHNFASMSGYNPQGAGWRICFALDAGVHEITQAFPKVTSVGVKGDDTHQQQGDLSAHNPLITAPDGTKLVLATDLVGPQADLDKIQSLIEVRYNNHDPRQWPFGFTQMNGYGTVWDNDPHTTLHYTGADYGHLHWNINTVTFPIQDNYRSFMDDISSWGIAEAGKPASQPKPEEEEEIELYLITTDAPGLVAVIKGDKVQQIHSGQTVAAFTKSGVKHAQIARSDFDAFIKGGK
jgi:hypothetical protein